MESLGPMWTNRKKRAANDGSAMERPTGVGVNERRMHVRAYNHWRSMLNGRPYPSIGDFDPRTLEDFGGHSVLLDLSSDFKDPKIAYLGGVVRDECVNDNDIHHISEVPARSLLSRLTDHYLETIANRAPVGFEAEFFSQRGLKTLYRGILLPLSSNGELIDYIYGVINWKELVDSEDACDAPVVELPKLPKLPALPAPPADPARETADIIPFGPWPAADGAADEPQLPDDDSLTDLLCAARESAEQACTTDQRSRAALYRALGQAYDFALAADRNVENYARMLEDVGLKVQARAPMTPVVKLVFGVGYDKTRLTEFAAALGWARRRNLPSGALAPVLEDFAGGLKGVVAAERRERRSPARPYLGAAIRDRLRTMPAFAHVEIEMPETDDEFVLLVARRETDGRLGIVAPVADARLTDQAIRRSAAGKPAIPGMEVRSPLAEKAGRRKPPRSLLSASLRKPRIRRSPLAD